MKHKIRKEVLEARNSHHPEQAKEKNLRIEGHFFDCGEYRGAKVIMFYVGAEGEVQTGRMIRDALAAGKRVVVPVSDTGRHEIVPYEIKGWDELAPGAYGILEPKPEFRRPVDVKEIDTVVVPGVAFDRRGYRVGYGKGYYDKFLPRLRPGAAKVALAYDFQVRKGDIPAEEHDVHVDKVITEEKILDCHGK